VRPTQYLVAALVLPASIFLCGCSNKVDRIVGNERLIRGPGGLGTTVGVVNFLTRDTYVTAGAAANFGPALLVGQSGSFDALSLFRVTSWKLPDSTRAGFTPVAVHFVLPQRQILGAAGTLSAELSLTAASWDSSVAWPGPTLGAALGTTTYDFIGQLRVNLGPTGYSTMKQWAADPSLAPGFALVRQSTGNVGSFQAGGAVFRIFYHYTGPDSTETDSTDSHVSLNAYIHSPLSAPQTGTETALIFGGVYECALALRGPVPPIAEGNSVNEFRVVLPVTGTTPAGNNAALPETTILNLDIFRIRGSWAEGVTDVAGLTIDAAAFSSVKLPEFYASRDTALSIPLPRALMREWGADSTSNEGILIKIRDVTVRPIPTVPRIPQTPAESPSFLIGSRESSKPPFLRASNTSPPPGRF
jgi:hypothetical protein